MLPTVKLIILQLAAIIERISSPAPVPVPSRVITMRFPLKRFFLG